MATTATATTTKTTAPRALPWGRFRDEVERQIAAHTTPESIEAAYQAYLAGQARTVTTTSATGAPRTEEYFPARPAARAAAPIARTTTGLSEKQVKLVDALLSEKVHEYTEAQVVEAKADWRKGRVMIDTLIAAARKPYQAPVVEAPAPAPVRERFDFNSVPDGNYAYYEGDPAADLVKFYRVDTNGTWKNLAARGGDTLYPVKNTSAKVAIMRRILEVGLEECRMLFSTKLDRCWMCGRHLTNDASRAIGMGPDCASK